MKSPPTASQPNARLPTSDCSDLREDLIASPSVFLQHCIHSIIGSLEIRILIPDHEITTGQCLAYNEHSNE